MTTSQVFDNDIAKVEINCKKPATRVNSWSNRYISSGVSIGAWGHAPRIWACPQVAPTFHTLGLLRAIHYGGSFFTSQLKL